jgi:hypothetical protein
MPVKKPKSPPKRGSKAEESNSQKGSLETCRAEVEKKQATVAPPLRIPTFWETLSIDRKLDVIGVGLALVGLLALLSLISAERSALIGANPLSGGSILVGAFTSCLPG